MVNLNNFQAFSNVSFERESLQILIKDLCQSSRWSFFTKIVNDQKLLFSQKIAW